MLKLGPIGRAFLGPELAAKIQAASVVEAAVVEEFGEEIWNELARQLPPWLVPTWFSQVLVGGSDEPWKLLARGLAARWRLFNSDDREALAKRAAGNGLSKSEEKVLLALIGVQLAAADINRPQTIRLRERWILDDDAHQAELKPIHLQAPYAIRWLASAAKAAARATLVNEAWPESGNAPTATLPLDEALSLADATGPESLASLIDAQRKLETCYAIATDIEREVFDLLATGHNIREAAEMLGIPSSTAQSRLDTFRNRFSSMAG